MIAVQCHKCYKGVSIGYSGKAEWEHLFQSQKSRRSSKGRGKGHTLSNTSGREDTGARTFLDSRVLTCTGRGRKRTVQLGGMWAVGVIQRTLGRHVKVGL